MSKVRLISIDGAKIASQFKEAAFLVQQDIREAVQRLAAATHAHVADNAQRNLKSTRKTYTDNLGFQEVSPGVWVVSLGEKAMWIEEGLAQGDMKPGLLKNAKNISKDGHRYRAIPFDYGKPPSQQTPFAKNMRNEIRQELKKRNIIFNPGEHKPTAIGKFEVTSDGSPRIGKVGSYDFNSPIPGRGNTQALKNVSIYQSVTKSGNIRRDILTFRTVSEGPASKGKWFSPGYKAQKFMDKAADWCEQEFNNIILPEILRKWSK